MERIESDIHEIKNTIQKFTIRLELVYHALVGNEISQDGGLVGDIINQRLEISKLEKRIEEVERMEDRHKIYVKILWGAAGVIVTMIISYFIKK